MDIDIFLDDNFDVNTIINVRLKSDEKPENIIRVNDFDLEKNSSYKVAFDIDNNKDIGLNTAVLNKNDIWHKRQVFIQLYWLLDYYHSKEKINKLRLEDGICRSKVNNIFYSDGERNFSLFTSPVYNINRVVDSFLKDKNEIELIGNRKKWMTIKQTIREFCFFGLSFLMFFKLFLLKTTSLKKNNKCLIPISRGYAHVSYFANFIPEEEIIKEEYSFINILKNSFSLSFWKALTHLIRTSIRNIRFDHLEIEPNSKYSKSELLVKYIQSLPVTLLYLCHSKSEKNKHVISAELLTAHSSILYYFVKKNNSILSIVQTVSLFKTNNFHFNYCDHFLFESFSLYEWFYNKHDKPKNYLFEGNVYDIIENRRNNLNKILFISQPSLKSEDIDHKIVSKIVNLDVKQIDVRLHPRDSDDRYDNLKVKQSRDLNIEDYDLIITRTSSMAVQAIYQNVPIIYCLFDDWSRKNDHYYIPKKYKGNAYSIDDLNLILNDYPNLLDNFSDFRNSFFKANSVKDSNNLKSFFSC